MIGWIVLLVLGTVAFAWLGRRGVRHAGPASAGLAVLACLLALGRAAHRPPAPGDRLAADWRDAAIDAVAEDVGRRHPGGRVTIWTLPEDTGAGVGSRVAGLASRLERALASAGLVVEREGIPLDPEVSEGLARLPASAFRSRRATSSMMPVDCGLWWTGADARALLARAAGRADAVVSLVGLPTRLEQGELPEKGGGPALYAIGLPAREDLAALLRTTVLEGAWLDAAPLTDGAGDDPGARYFTAETAGRFAERYGP